MNYIPIYAIFDMGCNVVLQTNLGEYTFLIFRNILTKSTFLKVKKQAKVKHPSIIWVYFSC